jgi:putative transposase
MIRLLTDHGPGMRSPTCRTQTTIVAAGTRQAFQQQDQAAARASLHQLHNLGPKLKAFVEESMEDVLAYVTFPAPHRVKLRSTNPLERLNKELKRRADLVGIFPNEEAIYRLMGAVLLEQNDEWQLQHCYMQIKEILKITPQAT